MIALRRVDTPSEGIIRFYVCRRHRLGYDRKDCARMWISPVSGFGRLTEQDFSRDGTFTFMLDTANVFAAYIFKSNNSNNTLHISTQHRVHNSHSKDLGQTILYSCLCWVQYRSSRVGLGGGGRDGGSYQDHQRYHGEMGRAQEAIFRSIAGSDCEKPIDFAFVDIIPNDIIRVSNPEDTHVSIGWCSRCVYPDPTHAKGFHLFLPPFWLLWADTQLSKPRDTRSRYPFIKPSPDIEDEAIQLIGFRASEVTAHECRPASQVHHGNAQILKSS